MQGSDHPAVVTPAGVRDGDPSALEGLCARRGAAVLAFCREVCEPDDAPRAAAETFARFRAAVVVLDDLAGVDPDDLLLGATRHAAASLARAAPDAGPRLLGLGGRGRSETCAFVPELLVGQAAGSLGSADLERLDEHLERCAACREVEAAFARAEHAYREPGDLVVPRDVARSIVAALAAAAPVTAGLTPPPTEVEEADAEAAQPEPEAPAPPAPDIETADTVELEALEPDIEAELAPDLDDVELDELEIEEAPPEPELEEPELEEPELEEPELEEPELEEPELEEPELEEPELEEPELEEPELEEPELEEPAGWEGHAPWEEPASWDEEIAPAPVPAAAAIPTPAPALATPTAIPRTRRRPHVHWHPHVPHVDLGRLESTVLPAGVVTVGLIAAMAIAGVFGGPEPTPPGGSLAAQERLFPVGSIGAPARDTAAAAAAEIARQADRAQRRAARARLERLRRQRGSAETPGAGTNAPASPVTPTPAAPGPTGAAPTTREPRRDSATRDQLDAGRAGGTGSTPGAETPPDPQDPGSYVPGTGGATPP
jgi:hypothetical protein